MPPYLATVYATDEHIAVRATGDFTVLCPDWQRVAAGVDGVFAADAPWTLTSASVDFEAAGVASGHVISLTAPKATFKGSGELLAVDAENKMLEHFAPPLSLSPRPTDQGAPPSGPGYAGAGGVGRSGPARP